MSNYDANSVEKLTFKDAVRKRIGIYLGSADHTGVLAGLLELVNNATDEALVCKNAKQIEITIWNDKASCRDYGRGMPHGKNKFSEEVMVDLLTENHSGAKFDTKAYGGKSRGLNGTGSAATCCSSDWFEITSYRDGAAWYMKFEKGVPLFKNCQKKETNEKQGTYIIYKPSQEVFSSEPVHFDFKEVCDIIKEYSYFNKGITFVVTNGETGEVKKFMSKNGLIDFAKEHIKDPIHKTPIHLTMSEDDIDIEIILQWTNHKEQFFLFSNGGENPDGGTPITGIKTAITTFMKKQLKGQFDGDMARTGLTYVCSVNLTNPVYDGQTKTKITNPALRGLAQRATGQALNDFAVRHKKEFEQVIEFLTTERKAEMAAERARKKVLDATKDIEKNQKRKVFASDKLKDAEYLGDDSTLLLVEGNSAASAMAVARDVKKYGILGLRGKLINALSNTDEDIYNNEEIKLLLSAMNIIPGKYDASKLRYGKIAIAVDADSDGGHIALLITAAIHYLFPEFLREGRLYWLRAPLYMIKKKTGNLYFYSDEEYSAAKVRGETSRFKGLGAMSEAISHESMFGPAQRMDQLVPDEESIRLLEDLMGKDVQPRRDFVFSEIDFSEVRE